MNYVFYIVIVVLILLALGVKLWRTNNDVETKRLVLLQSKTRGRYLLVEKEPNCINIQVTLKDKASGKEEVITKTWPLTDFNVITVPYPNRTPGKFTLFNRDIEYTEIDERDWNPITNTSDNREVIASPVFLGNLINERVTASIVTMGKEVVDAIKGIGKILNPNHFYIAVVMLMAGIGAVIYIIMPLAGQFKDVIATVAANTEKIDMLIKALGLQ